MDPNEHYASHQQGRQDFTRTSQNQHQDHHHHHHLQQPFPQYGATTSGAYDGAGPHVSAASGLVGMGSGGGLGRVDSVEGTAGGDGDFEGDGEEQEGEGEGEVDEEEEEEDDDDDEEDAPRGKGKNSGRRKIEIEYIQDKAKRHITFSKRKAGIMKKAYELSTLTGTQVLLLVVSETGLVYTYTTTKLQPLVMNKEGRNLIQACLVAPDGEEPDLGGQDPSGSNASRGQTDENRIPGHPPLRFKQAKKRKSSTSSASRTSKRQDPGPSNATPSQHPHHRQMRGPGPPGFQPDDVAGMPVNPSDHFVGAFTGDLLHPDMSVPTTPSQNRSAQKRKATGNNPTDDPEISSVEGSNQSRRKRRSTDPKSASKSGGAGATRATKARKILPLFCEHSENRYRFQLGQEPGDTCRDGLFEVVKVRRSYAIMTGTDGGMEPFKMRLPVSLTKLLAVGDRIYLRVNLIQEQGYWVPTACGNIAHADTAAPSTFDPEPSAGSPNGPIDINAAHEELERSVRAAMERGESTTDAIGLPRHRFQTLAAIRQMMDRGELSDDGFEAANNNLSASRSSQAGGSGSGSRSRSGSGQRDSGRNDEGHLTAMPGGMSGDGSYVPPLPVSPSGGLNVQAGGVSYPSMHTTNHMDGL